MSDPLDGPFMSARELTDYSGEPGYAIRHREAAVRRHAAEDALVRAGERITEHRAALAQLIPERDKLLRELDATGLYSLRDLGALAGISHMQVRGILGAGPKPAPN